MELTITFCSLPNHHHQHKLDTLMSTHHSPLWELTLLWILMAVERLLSISCARHYADPNVQHPWCYRSWQKSCTANRLGISRHMGNVSLCREHMNLAWTIIGRATRLKFLSSLTEENHLPEAGALYRHIRRYIFRTLGWSSPMSVLKPDKSVEGISASF